MDMYLGKNRTRSTADMTATRATVRHLTRKVEGHGYKPYMDNFFSSPDLFDDLTKRKISCCRTVRPNRKGMPRDLLPQNNRLKRGDILSRTRDDLTAMVWRDKKEVHLLTNMHHPPANGNFCDEHGNAIKPEIIQDYNRHMGYVDLGDRMTHSYSIQRRTWRWTKKLFFHLLDMTILNSFLLFTACGTKITHRDFQLSLVRNLIERAASLPRPHRPLGRPCVSQNQVTRLEVNFSSHWPFPSSRLYCRACSAWGIKKRIQVKCKKCDVGLCLGKCFEDYHTKLNLWYTNTW
jgi:hypothetical protein